MKVMLEYKFKEGDVSEYKTYIESATEMISAEGTERIEAIMELDTTQKIIKVNPDGTYNVEVMVTNARMKRDGEDVPIPNLEQPIMMKMSKNGKVMEMRGAMAQAGTSTHPSFPSNSVDVGDTWSGDSIIEIPGTDKKVKLHTDHKLERFETIQGRECAVIKVITPDTEIPIEENITQIMKVTGSTYFDYKAGTLVKSIADTNTSMTLPTGQTVKTYTRMTINLVGTPKVSAPPGQDEEFLIPNI